MRMALLVPVVLVAVSGCALAPLLGFPAAEVYYKVDLEAESQKKKEEK